MLVQLLNLNLSQYHNKNAYEFRFHAQFYLFDILRRFKSLWLTHSVSTDSIIRLMLWMHAKHNICLDSVLLVYWLASAIRHWNFIFIWIYCLKWWKRTDVQCVCVHWVEYEEATEEREVIERAIERWKWSERHSLSPPLSVCLSVCAVWASYYCFS